MDGVHDALDVESDSGALVPGRVLDVPAPAAEAQELLDRLFFSGE